MKITRLAVLAAGTISLIVGNIACTTGHQTTNPPAVATAARPGSAPVAHGKSPVTTSAERN